jgi:fructuronate reductase
MSMAAGLPDKPRLKRATTAPRPAAGIVHLGPGAFFRAFNALYTAEAMRAGGGDWGICAVSLRSPATRDKLKPQDYVYTSVALTPDGAEYTVIDVIQDMLVAPEDPAAVLSAMADPAVRIVSMTMTEKGYCHHPASGELRPDHPDIAHDLTHPQSPRSAPGFLVHALAQRRAAGLAPFTVLSCDNLPDNGALTRRVVLAFARALDSELADWIEATGCFPATMVDRITPATTDADIAALAGSAGYQDEGCVVHEPFRQWVIEDNFVRGERPDWDLSGAQFTGNVGAFETMKLRCLNGTHSALAYLGYLAGYNTIAETVADPLFAQLIDHLWHYEIVPTVPPPEGTDLNAYCAALKTRYMNPSIRHHTWQIAMDGSQKLPQRLLGTIHDNLAAGRGISALALVVAGWMRYVGGVDEQGNAIDVKDPLADKLRAAADSATDPAAKVNALLAVSEVFDPALAALPAFSVPVTTAYTLLAEQGTKSAIKRILGGSGG